MSISGFGIRIMLASWISSLLFNFSQFYLFVYFYCSGFCHTLTWISHGFTCVPQEFEIDGHSFLFKCLVEFTSEDTWSMAFLWNDLMFLLVIGQFRVSLSSLFSLDRLYASKNLPISSRLSSLFIVVSYDHLYWIVKKFVHFFCKVAPVVLSCL